jgi:hypothetical protein
MTSMASERDLFRGESDDPYLLAVRAYIWGYALVLAAQLRERFTNPSEPFAPRLETSAGAPLNNIGHQRRLSDPTLPGIAPNVDTLYTLAALDLDAGPFVLETPDFGSRFYTFQMGYGDTATELAVGTRTHGGQLPPVLISGPNHCEPLPPGMLHVACPTRYFELAGRILVQPDDVNDYDTVYDLQSRIQLRTLSRYLAGDDGPNPVPEQRLLDDGSDSLDRNLVMLNQLGNVLRDWIVGPHERDLVQSFSAIGLTREHGFRPDSLPAAAKPDIIRGLADGAALVERKTQDLGKDLNGWTINYAGPWFGDDYLLRSAVAKDQIYVTVPEEALYPATKVDADRLPLSGEHAYRLTFAAGALPPVDAFWSITMYGADTPLVPNPIDRYAIGDRTAGLQTEADGSLTIRIQHGTPPVGAPSNWLPAPPGPFRLMMRLYIPRASAIDGTWLPPAIERVPRSSGYSRRDKPVGKEARIS